MGRTWERRPKRRNPAHAAAKHMEYAQRACCGTHSRQPHAAGCQRHPRMCGDKAAFERGTGARQHARAHSIAGTDGSALWRAYRCPSCELWHLTAKEGKE